MAMWRRVRVAPHCAKQGQPQHADPSDRLSPFQARAKKYAQADLHQRQHQQGTEQAGQQEIFGAVQPAQ